MWRLRPTHSEGVKTLHMCGTSLKTWAHPHHGELIYVCLHPEVRPARGFVTICGDTKPDAGRLLRARRDWNSSKADEDLARPKHARIVPKIVPIHSSSQIFHH